MDSDALIDDFVAVVNSRPREPARADDSPPSVRCGKHELDGWCDWRIKPWPDVDWVEPLEQLVARRFGMDPVTFRFPTLYRSLLTRYIFPGFDVEALGITLLGNTPEGTDYHELRRRLFGTGLEDALFANNCLHFANPCDGRFFDPLCFDLSRSSCNGDHPIVRVDHEEILCFDRFSVVDELAPSFEDLILRVVRK